MNTSNTSSRNHGTSSRHTSSYMRHTASSSMRSSSDILHFPTQARNDLNSLKGWVCNISARYVFTQQHHEYLQIKPSAQHSQFTLICALLQANTCRVIYFDDQLTKEQLALIKQRHVTSNTELIHAKVAFMFAREVSTLHA